MVGHPSHPAAMQREVLRPKWSFHCQLAHGSPTGIISEFENVKQLYEKIAQCYDIDPSTVRFCSVQYLLLVFQVSTLLCCVLCRLCSVR